jgi:hypothetical protein
MMSISNTADYNQCSRALFFSNDIKRITGVA